MADVHGDYGFDAPQVPAVLSAVSLVALGLATAGVACAWTWLTLVGLGTAIAFALSAASYLYTTRRGKFAVWSELLDQLNLRGDERLLDVGCGRGAVLLLAARRLPRGRAIGIDVWSTVDQSGNTESTTRKNAELEGVSDRVELSTADMRRMPFADAAFDVVVSSLAIHNISDPIGRQTAVEEIARVLKPGGVALVADFRFTADYQRHLQQKLGTPVQRRRLDWRAWYGGPHAATSLVTARKPS